MTETMSTVCPVSYRIHPSNPAAHLFEVSCTVHDPDHNGQVFSLPAWIPGSYMIREFAKNIVELHAEAEGQPVAVRKLDKDTWQCDPCQGPLTVTTLVYAWDLSVRAAHLDTVHGYFNGTSVFLMVHGQEQRQCIVDIQPPHGEEFANWRVATAMNCDQSMTHGFGTYRAANYDELIDHPVEMGEFTLAVFEACGVSHEIAITGRHRADTDRLCADLAKVCTQHIRFFGEPAPFDRYVFLIMVVGEGYGGLEHRASTSLLCSRNDLPRAGETEVSESYRTFLGLCSHEYFHAWNVKRIKPAAFVPYDLRREAHTTLLWAFEGITSYYDDLALVRSGLITRESYLELLAQTVTRVWRAGGRHRQTLAESSFDAWTKFYRQDENGPNAIVSYYTKGALAALALDLTIRLDTGGAKSLDDVMHALWHCYGRTGKGVPEDGIERLAKEVTGLDLDNFFDRTIRGTRDFPLADLLEQFGIEFTLRAAESAADKGGKAVSGDAASHERAVLGATLASGGECRLAYVFDNGAAQMAGLAPGDVIVAVDGIRATVANLDKLISAHGVGTPLVVHAFRRDELMVFDVVPKAAPFDTCVLAERKDAELPAATLGKAWLRMGGES
jgi:predicted metalloprotease with PDZ domain